MLQRLEPTRGQFDGDIASRLRQGNTFTTHAVSQLDTLTLQELTGMEPGAASELLSEARAEVVRAEAETRTYSERLRQLKAQCEVELWDMMVRLHLIDELIGTIESEEVREPPTRTHAQPNAQAIRSATPRGQMFLLKDFTDLSYGEVIRLGISPQAIRRMLADLDAKDDRGEPPPLPSADQALRPSALSGAPPGSAGDVPPEVVVLSGMKDEI